MDSIELSDCNVATKLKVTSNSGLYLEGLTVLAHTSNSTELIDEYAFYCGSECYIVIVSAEQTSLPGIP